MGSFAWNPSLPAAQAWRTNRSDTEGTSAGKYGFSDSKVSGSGAIREEGSKDEGAAAAGAKLAGYSEGLAFEKDASSSASLAGVLEAKKFEDPVEDVAKGKATLELENSATGAFAGTVSSGMLFTESFSDYERPGAEGEGKSFSELIFGQESSSYDGTAGSLFELSSSTEAFGEEVKPGHFEGTAESDNTISGATEGNEYADVYGSFFGEAGCGDQGADVQ